MFTFLALDQGFPRGPLSNPDQTHQNKLIKLFRTTRKDSGPRVPERRSPGLDYSSENYDLVRLTRKLQLPTQKRQKSLLLKKINYRHARGTVSAPVRSNLSDSKTVANHHMTKFEGINNG